MNSNDGRRPGTTASAARAAARGGSTYIMTLGLAVAVTVIGLASVAVSRVNARGLTRTNDWAEAQLLAFAAAEHALTRIDGSSNWRDEFDGVTTSASLGRGGFTWRLVDQDDGDLTDDASDPAVVIATGLVGDASYSVGLALRMEGAPLEALRTAVTAKRKIKVRRRKALTATGGPVHTNGRLYVAKRGTVDGDVEAKRVRVKGTITGTVTAPADSIAMPDRDVFDMYKDLATAIPRSRRLEKMVISPQTAPGGATNADGVYYMDTRGRNLTIRKLRLDGTLVIKSRGGKVKIEDSVFMQSHRSDFPVLIVDGRRLELKYKSDSKNLSESEHGVNFNPPGSPYGGQSDSDKSDQYPNEIRGLVHTTAAVRLRETARVRGAIIAENKVECEGRNQIIYTPSLYTNPPVGYTSGAETVVPDAWTRIVD